MAIQISGTTVIDNSRNLSNIANASTSATANTYAITCADGSLVACSFKRTIASGSLLGRFVEGGYLICKSSSVAWIVAPSITEVIRNWSSRNDAVTQSQSLSGCSGWFIPTCAQLQNPGSTCRTYWDYSDSGTLCYWSSSPAPLSRAWSINVCLNGRCFASPTPSQLRVRAFRCVTY